MRNRLLPTENSSCIMRLLVSSNVAVRDLSCHAEEARIGITHWCQRRELREELRTQFPALRELSIMGTAKWVRFLVVLIHSPVTGPCNRRI